MVDDLFDAFEDLFDRRKKKGRRDDADDRDRRSESQRAPEAPPVFCTDCGARNEGNGRFCVDCGSVLPSPGQEMRCIRCEQVVPLTAKFCPKCGTSVVSER